MLELGHAQVGDGDEVLARPEAARGALGLLQQPVHRLDEGVAAVIDHAAHHRVEPLLERGGQLLERLEPAAPRPAQPGPEVGCGLFDAVVRCGPRVHLAQRHLQPPRPRALERRALQPVHGIELAGAPGAGVAPHAPQQLPERLAAASAQRGSHRLRVGGHLRAAHLVHRIDGHRDDVKAVVADLRLGQRQRHALGVGCAHVHAHVPHLGGIAAMGLQILGELHHRAVLAPLGGEQQPLAIQVVHDGDVVLPAPQAGLVDAHRAHAGEVFQRTRLRDVELDAPPQPLVLAAQQLGGLAHRQVQAQGQRQRFERRGEARARTRPGHGHLRGLAAGTAGHARHVAVQPGLELEEVQVPPGSAQPVVHRLRGRTACRAGEPAGVAADLEVDTPLGRVESDVIDDPRRLQAQRAGEQSFYGNAHGIILLLKPARWTCAQAEKRPAHMPTGLDDQESL